ncbi:MAG: roadblock/LC7 domain-containing protein [Candidatus Thorarchaeota archaeon]|jgi:predicted regulator of Ras-like GTPase activity (Roadblock/LC7/MglB family)
MNQVITSKKERLEKVLGDFKRNCDITGAAIVTSRGQLVWSLLPQSVEEKAVCAMAAAIMSIGNRVGTALDSGSPDTVLIDGLERSIILKGQGELLVIGIAPYNSEISLISFEMNNAVKKIAEIMGESSQ